MRRGMVVVLCFLFLLTGCSRFNGDEDKGKPVSKQDISKKGETQRVSKAEKGSSNTDAGLSLTKVSDEVDEGQQIVELIDKYEVGLIEAINSNNFSLVEPYLLKDSPLYKSQQVLVSELFSKGVKEEHVSHDYGYTELTSEDTREVEVVETIRIKHQNGKVITKNYQWIYTVNLIDQSIQLSNLRPWKDFDKDIETLEGSVKANGYYIDEALNGYDNALVDNLNYLKSKDLDNFLGNDAVRDVQRRLITQLRKKGHNFSLANSEIVESTNIESGEAPFKARKKILLDYIDNGSKKRKLSLTLDMVLEERRSGYRGLFGGYAIITAINVEDAK